MTVLKAIITILYIIVCIAGIVVVLMQEGKDSGLGALSGAADNTYWSKNKGRSKEGAMIMITRVLFILFIVLSVLLSTSLLG